MPLRAAPGSKIQGPSSPVLTTREQFVRASQLLASRELTAFPSINDTNIKDININDTLMESSWSRAPFSMFSDAGAEATSPLRKRDSHSRDWPASDDWSDVRSSKPWPGADDPSGRSTAYPDSDNPSTISMLYPSSDDPSDIVSPFERLTSMGSNPFTLQSSTVWSPLLASLEHPRLDASLLASLEHQHPLLASRKSSSGGSQLPPTVDEEEVGEKTNEKCTRTTVNSPPGSLQTIEASLSCVDEASLECSGGSQLPPPVDEVEEVAKAVERDQCTTLMLGNLPKWAQVSTIMDMLSSTGCLESCDYIFMPLDCYEKRRQRSRPRTRSIGYCFLNFTSVSVAAEFARVASGLRLRPAGAGQAQPFVYNEGNIFREAKVAVATEQGVESNVRRVYANSLFKSSTNPCPPYLRINGQLEPMQVSDMLAFMGPDADA